MRETITQRAPNVSWITRALSVRFAVAPVSIAYQTLNRSASP